MAALLPVVRWDGMCIRRHLPRIVSMTWAPGRRQRPVGAIPPKGGVQPTPRGDQPPSPKR